MSDWLRWPRLWYATPTFMLFIALQAPHWRFTGRVYVALLVWSLLGMAIDAWMTKYQHRPRATSQSQDIRRLLNGGAIFGFILAICALAFRPALDSVGHVASAAPLNAVLERSGILLPALDIFHHELVEKGRSDYAAYLGGFFVLVVVTWLVGFFLFYRAMAGLPPAEFAKAVAAKKNYGKGPYGERQQTLALRGLRLMAALLPIALLMFGRVFPVDASHSVQAGRAYIALGIFGWAINILIHIFHSCRRFLSTLEGGLLPGGARDSA